MQGELIIHFIKNSGSFQGCSGNAARFHVDA